MQPGYVQEREGRRLLGVERRQVRAGKQDSLRAAPVDQVAGGPLQESYLGGRPALSEQRDVVVHACTASRTGGSSRTTLSMAMLPNAFVFITARFPKMATRSIPAAASPAGMQPSTSATGPRATRAISSIARCGATAVTATRSAPASNNSLASVPRYRPSPALSSPPMQARTVFT